MSTAVVTFKDSRVGRNHHVEPVRLDLPRVDPAKPSQRVVDVLTKAIWRTACRHLASRGVEVDLTWAPSGEVTGYVYAGFHTVAAFTAEVTP